MVFDDEQQSTRQNPRSPSGWGAAPAPAQRLGPIISTVHTNNSTLTGKRVPTL